MGYVSPFGKVDGLPLRLAKFVERMSTDRSLPWVGLGLIHDLELVLKLLTLPEFADWLRTHPDDELQRWADEISDAIEARQAYAALLDKVEKALPPSGKSYEADVTEAGATLAGVRQVLVDCGALAADDTTMPLPDLIRALMS